MRKRDDAEMYGVMSENVDELELRERLSDAEEGGTRRGRLAGLVREALMGG